MWWERTFKWKFRWGGSKRKQTSKRDIPIVNSEKRTHYQKYMLFNPTNFIFVDWLLAYKSDLLFGGKEIVCYMIFFERKLKYNILSYVWIIAIYQATRILSPTHHPASLKISKKHLNSRLLNNMQFDENKYYSTQMKLCFGK